MCGQARDGKFRGLHRNGEIHKIAKELMRSARIAGGFADSDDESESDSVRLDVCLFVMLLFHRICV